MLGSIFRDSTPYLPRYFGQVRELAAELKARGDSLRVIWAEGDSVDDTWDMLAMTLDGSLEGRLLRCAHGGPRYGSVDQIERWRQVAPVCNAVLAQVEDDVDAVVYVESDLVWEPATMLRLLSWRDETDFDAISPMVWYGTPGSTWFYDVYAFRAAGRHFTASPPYHPALTHRVMAVESTGSCLVMRGDVARACRFGLETCLIGESLAEHGYSLWVDPGASIWHPS